MSTDPQKKLVFATNVLDFKIFIQKQVLYAYRVQGTHRAL